MNYKKPSQHACIQLHHFLTMAFPLTSFIHYLHFICCFINTHTYVCIPTTGTCAHIFVNLLNFAIMNGLLRLAG